MYCIIYDVCMYVCTIEVPISSYYPVWASACHSSILPALADKLLKLSYYMRTYPACMYVCGIAISRSVA